MHFRKTNSAIKYISEQQMFILKVQYHGYLAINARNITLHRVQVDLEILAIYLVQFKDERISQ